MKDKILKGGVMKYLKLFLLLFLLIACDIQHKNALRIKSINNNEPVHIDIIDVFTIGSGEEAEEVEVIYDQEIPIEFIYTEFGIGLPTAPGTYTALLTDYEITFDDLTPGLSPEDKFKGEKVKGKCNILIPSDPEGKRSVEAMVKIMPYSYIELYQTELSEYRVLGAKIRFKGKDLLSEKDLEVEGYFTINIADYWDDPQRQEPPK